MIDLDVIERQRDLKMIQMLARSVAPPKPKRTRLGALTTGGKPRGSLRSLKRQMARASG